MYICVCVFISELYEIAIYDCATDFIEYTLYHNLYELIAD